MKHSLKRTYACITTVALLGQFAISPNTTMAVEKEMPPQSQKSDVGLQNTVLSGVYFNDKHFRKPAVISPSENGELTLKKEEVKDLLSTEKQQFQSVRWAGVVTPDETGEYTFSTSADEQVMLRINGNLVIEQAPTEKKIKLEQGKSYEISIEYLPSQEQANSDINLQLFWATSTKKKEIIPKNNLQSPEFIQNKQESKLFPKKSLFDWDDWDDWDDDEIDDSLDTDADGIPDIWEIEGYTIQKKLVVKWDDHMAEKGYKKYRSNPYEERTAGDPYSDLQKATNDMDPANDKVTRNPLVAAHPTVGVIMDNITISRNNDITVTTGGDTSTSFTKGTSNSKTNETSQGNDKTLTGDLSISLSPSSSVSNSVTKTFNQSNSSTSTIDESTTASSGKNWAQSIGINTAQSAFLGPRVRYINTGTAPVYQLKPDVSIGIGENHTLTSGIVDEKYKANVLNPGDIFPKKGSLPILVNKHENVPISINYNELMELEKNKKVKLDSTQFDGIVQPEGNPNSWENWEMYVNNIDYKTAKLIFVEPEGWVERRIAAPRDLKDPEDMTPKIDVSEALNIGFEDFKKNGDTYQYKNYVFNKIHMIYDEDTAESIKEQANEEENGKIDPYNIKLKARMNIQISPEGWVTNDKTSKKYYFENGQIKTGFLEIDGKAYIFDSKGELVVKPGWIEVNGKKYYIDAQTKQAVRGWHTIDNAKYYFGSDGEMKTGWWNIDNSKYYFGTDGKMRTGYQTIDGSKYYFDKEGKMRVNGFISEGVGLESIHYYFGEDGKMRRSWQTIDGYKYNFSTNGVMLTGEQYINGRWHEFASDGKWIRSWG